MLGAPLVALFAAAILVEEPHCFANFPICLLYVSSSADLIVQTIKQLPFELQAAKLFKNMAGGIKLPFSEKFR